MAAILGSVAAGAGSPSVRRIITIAPGNSKSDWPVAGRPADRNRNRIVTLARPWYRHDRPTCRRASAVPTMHGRSLGLPVRDAPKHEKFRSPRPVRLALQGPIRPVDRLRGDGGPPLLLRAGRRLSPAAHPVRPSESAEVGRREDRFDRDDIASSRPARSEAEYVLEVAPGGRTATSRCSRSRASSSRTRSKQERGLLYDQERAARRRRDDGRIRGREGPASVAQLEELRRGRRLAEARQKELLDCSSLLLAIETLRIDRRLVDIHEGDRGRRLVAPAMHHRPALREPLSARR